MKSILKRLKTDVKERSGTSPTFLVDLEKLIKAHERLIAVSTSMCDSYFYDNCEGMLEKARKLDDEIRNVRPF